MSPHSVIPSLSPSTSSGHPSGTHNLVGHGGPAIGGHGGSSHTVAITRASEHHPRGAELVRLSSSHSSSSNNPPVLGGSYPVYQMVSPVPSSSHHHSSSSGLSQHSQVSKL